MGDRSNSSGVRNIRAMFEAKAEEKTSPPSRGRSPANSDATGIGSRPISKVRTSFVAVERSGQLGPMLGLRKSSDVDAQSGGARTPSISTDARSSALEDSAALNPATPAKGLAGVKEEDGTGNTAGVTGTPANGAAKGSVNGKSKNIISSMDLDTTIDLGTVLKGSPFEGAAGEQTKSASTPKPDAKKPPQSSTKPSAVKAAAKALSETGSAVKSKIEEKTPILRPSAISTKAAPTKAGPGPQSAKPTKSEKVLKTPTTPKEPSHAKTASPRQAASKMASPKQPVGAKEASKAGGPSKAPVRKVSRLSLAPSKDGDSSKPKSSATAPMATSAAKTEASKAPAASSSTAASKKPGTQTTGGFIKPAPKSPTRPARLPSAAMATTASASAKLPGTTRSPSRASNVGADRKATASKAAPRRQSGVGIRPKASRQSLAASTTSHNERPASRSSVAGKGADEGFLARMMRPTQASASKTHEKVEVKSPPRKTTTAAKPKRKSEGPTIEKPKAPVSHPGKAVEKEAKAPSIEEKAQPSEDKPAAEPVVDDADFQDPVAEPAANEETPIVKEAKVEDPFTAPSGIENTKEEATPETKEAPPAVELDVADQAEPTTPAKAEIQAEVIPKEEQEIPEVAATDPLAS